MEDNITLHTYKKDLQNIKERFLKDSSFINRNIIDYLKQAQLCLKDISAIKEVNISSIYEDELIYKFYFFCTMVGFIDAKIDRCKSLITIYSSFIRKYKEIEEQKELLTKLLLDREEVILNYVEDSNFVESFSKEALDVLNTQPSYLRFPDLYITSQKHVDSRRLQSRFIDSYNIGYVDSERNYNEVIDIYRELYQGLNINKSKVKK